MFSSPVVTSSELFTLTPSILHGGMSCEFLKSAPPSVKYFGSLVHANLKKTKKKQL